ncbi:MAG: efflux RND transporter periplasmic adaptor subunit [Candidatus Eisenbacteria bacterium]
MNSERNRRAALAAAFAAAVLLAGCGGKADVEEYVPPTTPVKVRPAEQLTFIDYFTLLGVTRAAREATLVFEVGGVIEEILADQGSAVRAGDPIARLDDELYRAALDEAKAARDLAAEIQERSASLREKGGISDFDLSRLELERAMAEARFRTAKAQHDRTVLRAPFPGVVDTRLLDPGDYATPLAPFVRFLDISVMKAEIPVPEVSLTRVAKGGTAEITTDTWPGRTFEGKVTFVSREVSGATRTVTVEVTIPNGDGALRPGMTVRAKMVRDMVEDAVVVPQDALVETEEGPAVFLAVDGKAVLRPVVIGPIYGEKALVESGLSPGEPLIVVGNRELVDGDLVEVLPGD